jgi:hypothetical protein
MEMSRTEYVINKFPGSFGTSSELNVTRLQGTLCQILHGKSGKPTISAPNFLFM